MKQLFAGLLLCFVTFTACKKTDPPVQAPVNLEANIVDKNWKLTALTVSPAMGGITDIYHDMYEDCERDNLFRFKTGGIFELDEGATVCFPGDPQIQAGTWTYSATTQELIFVISPGDVYTLKVSSCDGITLKATTTDAYGGVSYTGNFTFVKQ